jgi:predicted ABC-class ATPase
VIVICLFICWLNFVDLFYAFVLKALEMGAKTLLIDEDTCATNFMTRDDKMMELVHKDKEPITPFLYKAKTLAKQGISMIIVVGSCGDFFDIADTTIMMDSYTCLDVTDRAKQIATANAANAGALAKFKAPFGSVTPRCPVGEAFKPNNKVAVRSKSVVSYGDVELDLSGLEQLVSREQTNAIALALQRLAALAPGSQATIFQILTHLNEILDREGLDALTNGQFDGSLARPRVFEIAAAINRLRVDGSFVQLR